MGKQDRGFEQAADQEKRMRIAQVAPLAESVPPRGYGGTERVISWLTEDLVRRGHDVTLFASGDSRTEAKLVPVVDEGLRLKNELDTYLIQQMIELEQVAARCGEFDVIHYHCDYHHFPLSRRSPTPTLTTLHGRLDLPGLPAIFSAFPEMPLVSISDTQRRPLGSHLNWWQTIYHGLPKDSLRYSAQGGDYFAFLGRICPEKRVDRAIEIARRLRVPLKIAAKVDPADREFYETKVRPLLEGEYVEWIGEIGDEQKSDFLGNAKALLFPIDWPEPFGLVMIESLACGTPVVAFDHGSVPEVLKDGYTGYVVRDMETAVARASQIDEIKRSDCRSWFESRFSVETMTSQYIKAYERLLETPSRRRPRKARAA